MFHKLELKEITSRDALGDGFKSFLVGLSFFLAAFSIIIFIRTNSKPDFGQFGELSGFFVIPIVNTALFSVMLFGLLQIFGVGTKFESVVVLCCFAMGALLPFVSLGMWLFLDRAVQLAIEHRDPSLPYLKAAVYQMLFEEEEVWFVRVIAWLGVSISLGAIGFYIYWMIQLLSKVSRRGNRTLVAIATAFAWLLDGFLVRVLDSVFWRLLIQQQVVGHHV